MRLITSKHGKGDDQHQGRDRGCGGIVVFLKAYHDQKRCNFRYIGKISGNEDYRSVFADGAREGKREAGEHGRREARQQDAGDRLEAIGAECGSRFLDLAVDLLHHRLHRSDHERQADEDQRDHDACRRECDLDAERRQILADPAVGRVERGQRNARDGGRQRKRQVDHSVEDAFARETVSHQDPGRK